MSELAYFAGEQGVASRASRAFFRVALVCGGLPLVLGVGTMLLFVATSWGPLIPLGLVMILVGTLVVLVGLGFLIASFVVHFRRARRLGVPVGDWRFLACLGLLLMNFPAAYICAALALMVLPGHH